MADNVTLNSMSGGAVVATDDTGTSHVQIVKLAISADGSATVIPADATNGIDVDVTRVIPGTTATSLGKAEDAAHASGDTGVMALAVRNDSAATSLSGTDGDYTPIAVDANGRQFVVERGATIAHGQVSVTTSAASFIASSTTRRSLTIQNLGTDYVYLGASGITANNGIRLAPGQTFVLDKSPNAQVFAIASSGTQVCSYLTESD